MYLAHIKVVNFRIFGTDENSLDLRLNPRLNLVVGENDCGKSALIDATRFLLRTRDYEPLRLSIDDFHLSKGGRATKLRIEGRFEDLTPEEAGMFLEWLGIETTDGEPHYFLRVWLEAQRRENSGFDEEITVLVRGGIDDVGTSMDEEVRKYLRATYLRPMRNAEQELASKKGSRLSQIMHARLDLASNGKGSGEKLIEIIKQANDAVTEAEIIQESVRQLKHDYFGNLKLQDDPISPNITISLPTLRNILERLQLFLADEDMLGENTPHGLGLNNLLFIATELLLLEEQRRALSLLLIEEPEAHLHPQLQLKLAEFLEKGIEAQVIMTSHSPNLGSKIDLKHLIIMKFGQAYPMGYEHTLLNESDYAFLKRFLDVTRANLFFARGIIVVEGTAEQILLPVMAELIGRPLAKYGVSVINVGHVGLFRYAKIFQRSDGKDMGVRVACVSDCDIPSDFAYENDYLDEKEIHYYSDEEIEEHRRQKSKRVSGEPIRTFVSERWTLEHDICLYDYAYEMHIAVQLAKHSRSKKTFEEIIESAHHEFEQWRLNGVSLQEIAAWIYKPLCKGPTSKTETAQYFSNLLIELNQPPEVYRVGLPPYLINAIDYATGLNIGEE